MGHMEQKLIKERKKGNAKLWKKEIVTLSPGSHAAEKEDKF